MRVWWLWAVGCVLLVGLGRVAWADDPPDSAGWRSLEDPRRLGDLGAQALSEGDRAHAQELFEARLERMEVRQFLPYREGLRQALVLEALGEHEPAAAAYRAAIPDDPLFAALVLRILSQHPAREALVAEVYAHVREVAEAAAGGANDAQIYITSKGAPRFLRRMTTAQVVAAARRGEVTRYCYVDELDLTSVKGELPAEIVMTRCVIGSIVGSNRSYGKFALQKSFVLGDAIFGKAWEAEAHASATVPPSTFTDMSFRETVFMGAAGFAAIEAGPGRAYFPMVVFEGVADFKGAELHGVTEFRYASFGRGANFRLMRMTQPVYFGGTRYRADTVFGHVYSERSVYFNEATFEGTVSFEGCEFQHDATFENSRFGGRATFATSHVQGDLNLSRAVFEAEVDVREVQIGALDAFGAHFQAPAWFTDAIIDGRARFSLDAVTRDRGVQELNTLLPLYRHYQGDEDADEPLTTTESYGVDSVDDLDAIIDTDISFANTRFGGYTVFEGVQFGRPEEPSTARFYNAQFMGETHFEGTQWHSAADFTTIFGREIAFNRAHFHRALMLDDANVEGRVNLTDATFADTADLSLYASEIRSLQIDPDQVKGVGKPHRLFFEQCARGDVDRTDPRLRGVEELTDDEVRALCYGNVVDEFVALKDSYGDRAMTGAEDDAYWWARHHQVMRELRFGSVGERALALGQLLLFEVGFGWGVRLGNLGLASAAVTVLFALLYRWFCAETVLVYDGREHKVRDVSFVGLCFVSLQSLIAINTGWDFGDDDHTFRYLNTAETLIGFIILTFFVGAYTRIILA